MKTKFKVLIGVGVNFILLAVMLITTLILDLSWIFFLILGGISILVWAVIGGILIYSWIHRRKPEVEKLNLEEATELAKYMIAHDKDNPDNFVLEEHHLYREGEPGADRDRIRVLEGFGTENKQKIWFILNLEDIKDIAILRDPTKEEVDLQIRKMARRQEQQEITETMPAGIDPYGNPLPARIRTLKVSRAVAEQKKEEAKAEEEKAF